MDLTHTLPTQLHVLRASTVDDAADLIAVGGDHSVDVLQVTDNACRQIASFHIGSRVTAIAWSSNSVSPSSSHNWSIELAAAGDDFGLHLLNKKADSEETVFPFGGGLSGHHGKVNDMTFCGGWGKDSTRYVATVGDDKMLMVWDLHPTVDIPSHSREVSPSRPQPTAYVIPFSHPLTTVTAHPSTSKEFLVADSRGSVFITDWRSDPEDDDRSDLRHSSLIELVDPHALAPNALGHPLPSSGSVAWRADSTDFIGAVYGSRFSIWDLSSLRGGKPFVTGNTFPDGGHRFRWSLTYPEYFAISTRSPAKGALIHVHNVNYVHAQPTVFAIHPRPHSVQDFDFLAMRGIPRIAAAVGRTVHIFTIGVDS
ncbi:Nucleoporin Nup37 [Leucoagaricus sp. SymC.cos]|nr:Nucleoporin Nup37 [Leucoagaricus sp. SymC.cos]